MRSERRRREDEERKAQDNGPEGPPSYFDYSYRQLTPDKFRPAIEADQLTLERKGVNFNDLDTDPYSIVQFIRPLFSSENRYWTVPRLQRVFRYNGWEESYIRRMINILCEQVNIRVPKEESSNSSSSSTAMSSTEVDLDKLYQAELARFNHLHIHSDLNENRHFLNSKSVRREDDEAESHTGYNNQEGAGHHNNEELRNIQRPSKRRARYSRQDSLASGTTTSTQGSSTEGSHCGSNQWDPQSDTGWQYDLEQDYTHTPFSWQ